LFSAEYPRIKKKKKKKRSKCKRISKRLKNIFILFQDVIIIFAHSASFCAKQKNLEEIIALTCEARYYLLKFYLALRNERRIPDSFVSHKNAFKEHNFINIERLS